MKKITVSVGIPAFNEEKNIGSLLKSVLSQNQDNFYLTEIIVVSDKSTDGTEIEIKNVKSKKIKLIINKKRVGQAQSQNIILKKNQSDVLVLLNADVLLTDKNLFNRIIKPFYSEKKIGIVGGLPVPLPGKTLFENMINWGVRFKNELYLNIGNNNIFLCHGRIRAFSQKFIRKFNWPDKIISEDAYSYLKCVSSGYKFYFVPKAEVFYRSPNNLDDHLKQSVRFFQGSGRFDRYFSEDFIKRSYKIPISVLIKTGSKYFLKSPLYFISYFCILLLSKILSFRKNLVNSTWTTSQSSKILKLANRKIRILIPNATSPRNIGDLAMLTVLVSFLKGSYPESSEIIVHSSDPNLHRGLNVKRIDHTLYSWAILSNKNSLLRAGRLILLFLQYAFIKLKIPLSLNKDLKKL